MRLIFMGTAAFAVPSLVALVSSSHRVLAVVTQPDQPRGRGYQVRPSPVKAAAREMSLEVAQPTSLSADTFRSFVATREPEVMVLVAYGKILPSWLIGLPREGIVNVHPSLLPRYRGAAPVNWAIARGENRTGVCTMRIDDGLDTGPLYACRETTIGSEECAPELLERLAGVGAELLLETLNSIGNGEAHLTPQADVKASEAPRLRPEDGFIRWEEPAVQIHDKIRGFQPWPGVVVGFRGKRCRILASRVGLPDDGPGGPGDASAGRDGLKVRCGDRRVLEILSIHPANGRVMSGAEFANGYRILAGDRFDVWTPDSNLRDAGRPDPGPDRDRDRLR